MAALHTVLFDKHVRLGARMVEFAGWEMPLHYSKGIVEEHLQTRKHAGLFDVSHMGRFVIRGQGSIPFLQHVLTNNCAGLEVGRAQYTMIPNHRGGALDDAYLYHYDEQEYLLVVNAANRSVDWEHFQQVLNEFEHVECIDNTSGLAMLSLQGPASRELLTGLLSSGGLPEPPRNTLSDVTIDGRPVRLARTGYTGEPVGFEFFLPREDAGLVWDLLVKRGAVPVGLGARDTLRLEAALPLYGHELGLDPAGDEIPIYACPLARIAVSLSPLKGDFVGRTSLAAQLAAYQSIMQVDSAVSSALPRLIRPIALLGKGIARAGATVCQDGGHPGTPIGWVTSGTMAPYWKVGGTGLSSRLGAEKGMRAVCLALVDARLRPGDRVTVAVRSKQVEALVVRYHLRSEAPPFARSILHDGQAIEGERGGEQAADDSREARAKAIVLADRTIANSQWRQRDCINLIPSEQTQSALTRLLSIMDPAFRYGEHRQIKALYDADIFYYQGTDFIGEVERLLVDELGRYLGCSQVETRVISGQMANTAVFSSLVDFVNRIDRKTEPRRLRSVMNNHILKGGHLSAQTMGALRDFVARDPETDKPAVAQLPVCPDNPYKLDLSRLRGQLERFAPELVILGKSMMIYREPLSAIRALVDEMALDTVIMYDMAHVLGLVGRHFQEPFTEGADIVTGSTHKTFFGTQRGLIAANYAQEDPRYELWETIERRAFPGSVSNHHLGTLLGLLMAAYEMNHFRDSYQPQVLSNAKALALALDEAGFKVAGEPGTFTETHQVIVNVGYGKGVEAARRLEQNNIIVNYQAAPDEEGFTASGALRLGVAEMTRFGMHADDFRTIAQLMHDVLVSGKHVKDETTRLRRRFEDLQYCFDGPEVEERVNRLCQLM